MRLRPWILVGGCLIIAGGGLVMAPLMMFMVVTGSSSSDQAGSCGESAQASGISTAAASSSGLDHAQLANATAVIAEGYRKHIPTRGIIIALAVAHQESGFRNYANDGRGSDLNLFQVGIQQSLRLPHQAVGSDHGSLGIFQQQWPWWGSMPDLMDPAKAADKFYNALLRVPGWQTMPVTVAGQAVQQSAYPSAYADDESLAQTLLRGHGGVGGTDVVDYAQGASSGCVTPAMATGAVTYPLPAGSGFVDEHNFGATSSRWAHGHTGTDLAAACGTPVLAATHSNVIVRTDQAWAGHWLIEVSTGTGRLTTWYGHMRAINVHPGQHVTAGQQIGQVGDLGNATGCHLHFEVHPRGGNIYQDDVNPSPWLRLNARRDIHHAAQVVARHNRTRRVASLAAPGGHS